ncbi:urocanate hydratase [Trichonephila inaurata madagascariensis]|uniref:Urocanate hydratase n=1 Tax=Trichonephila inaurata madagascariensis TaxID=2747483 RepID=A0A8X6YKV6_9ARAC|nr:urocanate hydratase [Trichonephila inaurata madagascariensis]
MAFLKVLKDGIPIDPLPPHKSRDDSVPHAPVRNTHLAPDEEKLALKNSLRYIPSHLHHVLAPEFAQELKHYGHIYMYRFRPDFEMRAYPITYYPTQCKEAAAIMLMIMNNLDPKVAQFPHELITYGGNGQVFSNWAQFWLMMKYLSKLTRSQTLVMMSGHPLGLFPSSPTGPRMVVTNGMMVPNYSTRVNYDRLFALGVTMYGQMTAGSYCYIGPQGIVHGTTLTLMNAGRKYLNVNDMSGKVYISSGLGGMSGAQAKAAVICGCIGVIAEVDTCVLEKRYSQGWVQEIIDDLDHLIARIREAKKKKIITSIGFKGNIVDIWERIQEEYKKTGELLADLGSDQTSCHNPFDGGYYPVQLTFDEAKTMITTDPEKFKELVKESLRRHVSAINFLADNGLFFWDYGNAFLLEAHRAGAEVGAKQEGGRLVFRYPSYVQHIMGDIFSLGFGPFRWVCTSNSPDDLQRTDHIAASVLEDILEEGVPPLVEDQYKDNIKWIKEASSHKMVVGSQARILYADHKGRVRIALAFNQAIKNGLLQGPLVLSRDHHDVSGTDSPFRETSNISDGSAFCADMAVQNCIGDSFRGATWVALHNGGGVGWGEVINGGFGLFLDGSEEAECKARQMLSWDVLNGVARRCWSGNSNAAAVICQAMEDESRLEITVPYDVLNECLIESSFLSK